MERTIAKSPAAAASFGISPVGKSTPFIVSGLNSGGVTPSINFRSNVSVWLGAPVSKIKMTLRARLIILTGVELTTVVAGNRSPSHEAVTPAPARLRKRRRVRCAEPGGSKFGD